MLPQPRNIVIACQGGGSLTAFTAGALKIVLRHLDARRYQIVGLSGTSGGAICAVLAWYGLLIDNPEEGARLLQEFWDDNAATAPLDAWFNAWLVFASRFAGSVMLPEISPYDMPEIAREQLKSLLERHIPFDRIPILVKNASPLLFVGAVNERTGEFKVFSGAHITSEKILASAAIPSLFRAVHITEPDDKGIYWDGLFSQNPPVREFVQLPHSVSAKPDEIWIIRVDPMANAEEPKSIQQIEIRRNTLAGNLSLNQELYFLEKVNGWVRNGWLPRDQFKEISIREMRLMVHLDMVSKYDRTPAYLHHLTDLGEHEAKRFISVLP